MNNYARNPKHAAVRTFDTSLREHQAAAVIAIGHVLHGWGKHRASQK